MEPPLRLNLREIPEGTSRRTLEIPPAELDLLGAEAEFLGPVTIDLEIIRTGEQFQVRGEARLETRQKCARCLEPVECSLRVPVEAVARRRSPRDSGQEPGEGMILHDGEQIELANEIRELILLAVPRTPLCRADCAGLCPQCGKNLNTGPCTCERSGLRDPRWADLEGLDRSE